MKRSRFTEEQIIAVLREAESGTPVKELCRRAGVSTVTFYKSKTKYGGMEISEMRRMRLLEEENSRLKRIVAQQALEKAFWLGKNELQPQGIGPLETYCQIKWQEGCCIDRLNRQELPGLPRKTISASPREHITSTLPSIA